MSLQPTGSHPRTDTWLPYGHCETLKDREKTLRISNLFSQLDFSSCLDNISVCRTYIFIPFSYYLFLILLYLYLFLCVHWGTACVTVAHVIRGQHPGVVSPSTPASHGSSSGHKSWWYAPSPLSWFTRSRIFSFFLFLFTGFVV